MRNESRSIYCKGSVREVGGVEKQTESIALMPLLITEQLGAKYPSIQVRYWLCLSSRGMKTGLRERKREAGVANELILLLEPTSLTRGGPGRTFNASQSSESAAPQFLLKSSQQVRTLSRNYRLRLFFHFLKRKRHFAELPPPHLAVP
ncbi:hypothetical protein R1flu_021333 [Riccia fluitans]|uniref:Uncharacterized protein n=1 Tax=Riccia fluitans TaxID=41844 RepID=A0ABD1ZP21_9MARC